MSTDWWSKRLGTTPTPTPEPVAPLPGRTLFARNSPPATTPQRVVEDVIEDAVLDDRPTRDDATHPAQFGQKILAAASRWRGGIGNKTERERCPQCGSGNFYQRRHGSRGPAPAPECFECGYNGLFSQTGNSDTYDQLT